jgi:hypothetical protein
MLTYEKSDESEQAHRQVYNGEQHHEGKFSHEFAAGAASFGAMKAYEDHERKSGRFDRMTFNLIEPYSNCFL